VRNTSLEARDDVRFTIGPKRKAWDLNPHPREGARISGAARQTVSGYLPYEHVCIWSRTSLELLQTVVRRALYPGSLGASYSRRQPSFPFLAPNPAETMDMTRSQYGILGILLGTTAVAVSFGLGKWLPSVGPRTCLYAWITLQYLHVLLAGYAFANGMTRPGFRQYGALRASCAVMLFPLATLILFSIAFVIGGYLNGGGLAGDSGRGLLVLWFLAWPLLFLGNAVAWLIAVISVVLPPYPPRQWASMVARLVAVLVATFACYTTVTYFPDP
jgi:hypothetical protein